ncbi:prolyl oligopeptidase family serine peptidase [Mesorhizobium sp. LHD-90]|uniref:S9 family peptidase n=1 Tax=Mesorhizobium sp. LHD-90 TaxID=3071414 RepID=UPI0027E12EF0|nr:prolyl oligopeptidase family serine peptidase [Mesorhizobium sp. LHD-90]MDQ6437361.1 prolyl oligopeptidase family serine peptidase [Mesorhizobium sp. LHD-90]
MKADFRSSPQFAETLDLYSRLLGLDGHVFSARGPCGHADIPDAYFIGQSFDGGFEDGVTNRLYRVARTGGVPVRLGDSETRQIRLSTDGRRLAVATATDKTAFDRIEVWAGNEAVAGAVVAGRIEQIDWSPAGDRLLLVVAGTGADLAGIHGGYAQKQSTDAPPWLPEVSWGEGEDLWRSIWTWDCAGEPEPLTADPLNVWEASWCGPDKVAAVTSDHHAEGSWYAARLSIIDARSGEILLSHLPPDQIGVPRGSDDGSKIAIIRAFCSDRGLVAGELAMIDAKTGAFDIVPTNGIDVTSVEWRSPGRVHLAGLRGHETVVADYDLQTRQLTEHWASTDLTSGEWAPASYPIGDRGALLVAESYATPPFLAEVDDGGLREIASFSTSDGSGIEGHGAVEPFSWTAPDGLIIQGWLVRPTEATAATPLLVDVHGGPVSAHRNRWMARTRAAPLLAARGWTILFPNPRGSTGRGDAFARAVKGDMGGADVDDILSGIDALVAKGWVDPARVAVTGTSYGGFMSAWLPTRSDRFAAAIPISPVGDWHSQHRTTQIPEFDAMFLDASPWDGSGAYHSRSPAFFRQRKKVPTLVMAGGIDKSTPPSQALECHFAALRSGSSSALVTYPNAGHSIRVYPEYFDSAARIVWWLNTYVGGASPAAEDKGVRL